MDKFRLLEVAGLFFAGLGAAFAGYGLLQQAKINEANFGSLAVERLNSLRGTSANALNDWSASTLLEQGREPADWPLHGLGLVGNPNSISKITEIDFVNKSGRDHSDASIHNLRLVFSKSFRSDFSNSEFWGAEITGSVVQINFAGAKFHDTRFPEVSSFRSSNFRDAWFIGYEEDGSLTSLRSALGLNPEEEPRRVTDTDFRGVLFDGYEGDLADLAGACFDETTQFRVGLSFEANFHHPDSPLMLAAKEACVEIDKAGGTHRPVPWGRFAHKPKSPVTIETTAEVRPIRDSPRQ